MNYRPIMDYWFVARSKVKFYGAYPAGFLERARVLLGVSLDHPVLHVCGGRVRDYPYRGGFGPNDRTLDLDPGLEPDFLQDARDPLPNAPWPAILIDPPYTKVDAEHYPPGAAAFPNARVLVANALQAVLVGHRVGILHYWSPRPPTGTKLIAKIAVAIGYDNHDRTYTVYERR